jgi:hypothetical protein
MRYLLVRLAFLALIAAGSGCQFGQNSETQANRRMGELLTGAMKPV